MTGSVHERRMVNVIYLDFHEVLDTISHSIFLCKLRECGLDDGTVRRKLAGPTRLKGSNPQFEIWLVVSNDHNTLGSILGLILFSDLQQCCE